MFSSATLFGKVVRAGKAAARILRLATLRVRSATARVGRWFASVVLAYVAEDVWQQGIAPRLDALMPGGSFVALSAVLALIILILVTPKS